MSEVRRLTVQAPAQAAHEIRRLTLEVERLRKKLEIAAHGLAHVAQKTNSAEQRLMLKRIADRLSDGPLSKDEALPPDGSASEPTLPRKVGDTRESF